MAFYLLHNYMDFIKYYPLGEDVAVESMLLTEKNNFQLKDFEEAFSKIKK